MKKTQINTEEEGKIHGTQKNPYHENFSAVRTNQTFEK